MIPMRHVIVSGASRGIGAAIVAELLGPGTTVYAISDQVEREQTDQDMKKISLDL